MDGKLFESLMSKMTLFPYTLEGEFYWGQIPAHCLPHPPGFMPLVPPLFASSVASERSVVLLTLLLFRSSFSPPLFLSGSC